MGLRQQKIEEAINLYKKNLISLWKAAEIAEIPLREMIIQARAYGCQPEYDEKMLEEEINYTIG